jgi:cell division protein ZapA
MENSEPLVHIHVVIAERQYPLRIRKGEEQKVEQAVAMVNDKIKEYQKMYAGKDKQDYLAMCVLMLAVEQQSLKYRDTESQQTKSDYLTELDTLLSAALS